MPLLHQSYNAPTNKLPCRTEQLTEDNKPHIGTQANVWFIEFKLRMQIGLDVRM